MKWRKGVCFAGFYRVGCNSAFANSKIPINLILKILLEIRETYKNFFESPNWVELNRNGEEVLRNKRENPARISMYRLSYDSEIDQKTVERLLDRIAKWMPKKYHSTSEAEDQFYSGIKKTKKWNAIFNLLFDGSRNPRSIYQIAYFLFHKKWESQNW